MNDRKATISAFGYDPTDASIGVIERTVSWRMTRAILAVLVGIGAAPIVFFVPPHVPWVLASVGLGLGVSYRFVRETCTLVSLSGSCPKCGAEVRVSRPVALRVPHALSCTGCSQGLLVVVEGAEP